MNLANLIDQAISLKEGNQEFALFVHSGSYTAMLGNTCGMVHIGEGAPEIETTGVTAEHAVQQIIDLLQGGENKRVERDW